MESILYLLLIVACVHFVENYSPHGDSSCSFKSPWAGSILGGTCQRYCSGNSGIWCYTGDYCLLESGELCSHRSTCSGQKCPIDEPDCVEECIEPPSKSGSIKEDSVGNVIACESTSLNIYCEEASINIIQATYGRSEPGSVVCPNDQIHNTSCGADSTKKVFELCSGKRACQVKAENSLFGDPCFGTHKYLKVRFNCV